MKNQFQIYTTEGWKSITGKEITLPIAPHYTFFAHRMIDNPKFFVVSEYISGMRVGLPYLKRQDAIQDANWQIEKYGINKLMESVIKAEKTYSKQRKEW